MTTPQYILGVLISAAALTLGIPNEFLRDGSAPLALIALAPLYASLVSTRSWRAAGLAGGLMMGLVHLASSFWLAYFKEFAIFTLGGSTLANVLMGIVAGWALRWSLLRPRWARPFVFAAAWTVWEWGKSIGFLAYPWGTLPMAARDFRILIQIADVTGVWGITFLLALFNALLAELAFLRSPEARREWTANAGFTALLFALTLLYGTLRLGSLPPPETTLDLTLIQHNADPWDSGDEFCVLESQRLTREALAARPNKPDMVVWSESVLPWPWEDYRSYYGRYPKEDPLLPFLKEIGVPLVTGAPVLVDRERKGYSNSAIYLSPEGEILQWYAKSQLVPFAEYMPFTEYKWVRTFFDTLVGFSSGWVPGKEYRSFPIRNADGREVRFTTPICFEDAFASVVANLHASGSDILINLTNDSWSQTASAETQHFAVASYRAIELRTTLVRSTNAGYTCVVDSSGRVLADLPLFEPRFLNVEVPVYPRTETFYSRYRDWFPSLAALVLAFMLAAQGITAIRSGLRSLVTREGSAPYRFHWEESPRYRRTLSILQWKRFRRRTKKTAPRPWRN